MKNVNILMLGGKRCGKTTVLSAMCNEINKVLAGTDLAVTIASEKTKEELEKARIAIQKKISIFETPLTRIEMDENPTSARKVYSFQLSMGEKGAKLPFQMHDIPGEWLTDAGHEGEIRKLIQDCHVIIIAIDTPYLFAKMTGNGYGIYHEEYNKPMEIANFFKNSLSLEDVQDRMILFVPMKCERYYHLERTPELNVFEREYMKELTEAIAYGYGDLLQYLRSPELSESCTVAITPILSAGGIDFVRFEKDDETGKMVSLYQEPEFLPKQERGYRPKFCEQPMLYALTYILLQAQEELGGQNRLYQQGAKLFGGKNNEQFLNAMETLRKKMKRSSGIYAEDGYLIIQNPRNI